MRGTGTESSAFTLIELLVVVAIIAILASILVPALREARVAAESSGCLVNLRKIGTSMAGYLKDNNYVTPPYVGYGSDPAGATLPDGGYNQYRRMWTHTEWFKSGPYRGGVRNGDGFLGEYLGADENTPTGIPFCPAARDKVVAAVAGGSSFSMPAERMRSLAVNLWATEWYVPDDYGGPGNGRTGRPFDELDKPVTFAIFADGIGVSSAYITDPRGNDPEDNNMSSPYERHGGRFNALFLDGHAESCTHETHYNEYYFVRLRAN